MFIPMGVATNFNKLCRCFGDFINYAHPSIIVSKNILHQIVGNWIHHKLANMINYSIKDFISILLSAFC